MLKTPEQFLSAVKSFKVEEVSPELFGTITKSWYGTLTRGRNKYAWASGSSNLYQFLVLNNRYQQKVAQNNSRYSSEPVLDAQVSEEAMNGLARIVGVPCDFNPKNPYDAGTAYSCQSQLIVYKDSNPKNLGTPRMVSWETLIDIINEDRPVNAPKIPKQVLSKLKNKYSYIAKEDYKNATPVESFSRLTGISVEKARTFQTDIRGRLKKSYLRIADTTNEYYDKYAAKARVYLTVLNKIGYDNPGIDDPDKANDKYPIGGANSVYLERFFKKFATGKINDINNNIDKTNNVRDLTVGVRALLDKVYGASPFFTGLGVGYREGRNPLLGNVKALAMCFDKRSQTDHES